MCRITVFTINRSGNFDNAIHGHTGSSCMAITGHYIFNFVSYSVIIMTTSDSSLLTTPTHAVTFQ